jgi:cytochrome c oxidase subunit 3
MAGQGTHSTQGHGTAGHGATDHEHYYVPEQSRLAICTAFGLFLTVFGASHYINDHKHAVEGSSWLFWLLAGLAVFLTCLFSWFRTTIIENRAGMNSAQLKHSYVIGMQWFIFSEVMFFFAFFGALFYIRTLAGPWLASEGDKVMNHLLWGDFKYSWPLMETPQQAVGGVSGQSIANNGVFAGPKHNLSFPGWSNLLHWLPLWNTVVLLSSSFTVHLAHMGLKESNRAKLKLWLGVTLVLAFTFVFLQYKEYHEAFNEYGLTLHSGIYGTTFFMLTGFHGFHVMMGAFILLVQFLRVTMKDHFTPDDQFGFEAASWYWHFVDVVWVGLFLFVYIL